MVLVVGCFPQFSLANAGWQMASPWPSLTINRCQASASASFLAGRGVRIVSAGLMMTDARTTAYSIVLALCGFLLENFRKMQSWRNAPCKAKNGNQKWKKKTMQVQKHNAFFSEIMFVLSSLVRFACFLHFFSTFKLLIIVFFKHLFLQLWFLQLQVSISHVIFHHFSLPLQSFIFFPNVAS